MEFYYFLILSLIIYVFHRRQSSKTKALSKKIDELLIQFVKLNRDLNKESSYRPSEELKRAPRKESPTKEAKLVAEKKPTNIVKEPKVSTQKPAEKIISKTPILEKAAEKEKTLAGLYAQGPKGAAKPQVEQATKLKKSSWLEGFKKRNPDLEKFIGENLINKIGILILVLGISYFVKFAIDKEWINEPARVGIGILCGTILMLIAHRLRAKYSAFSSVLVAGGISIFYFTIFIAFQDYQLFSQTVAFAIMTVITAFSTLVSVSYNRQELALIALIGGFASPFLVSSGEGNYIVFFSYLLLLNGGILAVSFFKKWKVVNLVSFLATTLFFAGWQQEVLFDEDFPLNNALLFSSLFYITFSISNVINNIRSKGIFNRIERSIIIANTFIYFGFGYQALSVTSSAYLSLYTLCFAIYNIMYAFILFRKLEADKTNIYLLIGLALSFVTLAIPLQFDGNQITLFWAAEAVLLFWLSQKSKVQSYRLSALLVQALALFSLAIDWTNYGLSDTNLGIVFNEIFITGIIVLVSLMASRFLLKSEESIITKYIKIEVKIVRAILASFAIISAYLIGFFELSYQSSSYLALNGAQAFTISYHLLFLAFTMMISKKLKQQLLLKSTVLISLLSVLIYFLNFSSLSEKEVLSNLTNELNSNLAFLLHYLQLLSFVAIAYVLVSEARVVFKLEGAVLKYSQWLGAIAIVILISIEVNTHSIYFLSSSIPPVEDFMEQSRDKLDLRYDIEPYYYRQIDQLKLQVVKVAYPITWGLIAFAFLLVGIQKNWKNIRIIALALLGITILKLFLYDIKDVSETGKIVAFILLGALILTISFVYQKIKKLVVDEKNDNEKIS